MAAEPPLATETSPLLLAQPSSSSSKTPSSTTEKQNKKPAFDVLVPLARAADALLSFRIPRILLLVALQPLVVIRYTYDSIAPKRFVEQVVRKRNRTSMSAGAGGTTLPPSLSPTRSTYNVNAASSASGHAVGFKPKFSRTISTASDLGSESGGSLYSTASTVSPYLPKINKYAVIRTPDALFAGLGEFFPFEPQYFKMGPLRVHYVESGRSDVLGQKTVILVHGALTWSYLYRKIIPSLTAAGLRVIAVDLPGHGRSDKFPADGASLLQLQVASVRHLLAMFCRRGEDVTLVAHGTGGLVVANAIAEGAEGEGEESTAREIEMSLISASLFYIFRRLTRPSTHVRCVIGAARRTKLTVAEAKGYDIPYPTLLHAHAPQTIPLSYPLPLFSDPLVLRLREIFPRIATHTPLLAPLLANNHAVELIAEQAKMFWSGYCDRVRRRRRWIGGGAAGVAAAAAAADDTTCPALVVVGERDRVWSGAGKWLAGLMGAELVTLPNAGHYSCEDDPEAVVKTLLAYIKL
ncbi:hypothetical protein HDU87_003346 [Geranomyces variabilis]|uniref:AB hydrolase-1 domain-containing protein n=1 Tax=Geranomyces variabilis TaxID=109894 RepID=A0AAD5TLH9_9FUNG|nr:hypothetical protein HDU87_003346 [Geranomyces variabilis]